MVISLPELRVQEAQEGGLSALTEGSLLRGLVEERGLTTPLLEQWVGALVSQSQAEPMGARRSSLWTQQGQPVELACVHLPPDCPLAHCQGALGPVLQKAGWQMHKSDFRILTWPATSPVALFFAVQSPVVGRSYQWAMNSPSGDCLDLQVCEAWHPRLDTIPILRR